MKKILTVVFAAAALSLPAACTEPSGPAAHNVRPEATPQTERVNNSMNKKILIAYYSYSGNTKAVAEQIAKATGGTLFAITTPHQYPQAYNAMTAQAREEIRDGFKPELSSRVENMAQYDTVFIGSPNWWGTYAPAVAAFLAAYDFKGKTVVPFITHGGGGMQEGERDMKKQLPGVAFGQAMAFPGRSSGADEKTLAAWLARLGLAK